MRTRPVDFDSAVDSAFDPAFPIVTLFFAA
jgi:hypothetical protein